MGMNSDLGAITEGGDASSPACGVLGALDCVPFDPTELKAGSFACSSADIHQFVGDCFGGSGGSPETCATWVSGAASMTACGQCVGAWTDGVGFPDSMACQALLYNNSPNPQACRDAHKCLSDCVDQVCSAALCGFSDGDDMGSELDRCLGNAPTVCGVLKAGGVAIETTLTSCNSNGFLQAAIDCTISQTRHESVAVQLELFYRGACRDNGRWENAAQPPL